MKTLLVSTINSMDDASYQGLCNIIFMAFGVTDAEGNITEEWANSPFWEVKGNELRPVVKCDALEKTNNMTKGA